MNKMEGKILILLLIGNKTCLCELVHTLHNEVVLHQDLETKKETKKETRFLKL